MKPEMIQHAVEEFWFKRDGQAQNLEDGGTAGGAARANGHLGGVTSLVRSIFVDNGLDPECVRVGSPYLPGYYRVRKQWDLVATYKDTLVAAIEFKSQVGSVGKNINNRFEEALGTATDTRDAQKKNSAFGEVPPWLGYVLVLEETEETEKPDRTTRAMFKTDEAFDGLSYNQRYQEMIRRFIGENVYNAGWFVTTQRHGPTVTYKEPLATATAEAFRVAIEGQINWVRTVVDQQR
ncbi:PaeR7I family type II restriction endonuclease [Kitasatospora sp. NPDC056327]|uniref:PaeR7I family type II restriction endonuclease n=1 Tax=Kitasatospora sp. NPDC056327 TaxID=3345785 RepID=UPI0035DDF2FB